MQEIASYLQNKKKLLSLVTLLVLGLAIPIGIYLVKTTQIFRPKADVEGIITLAEGNCVTILNGEKVLTCKEVTLKLGNPFSSPTSTSSPNSVSPSPSPSLSPSPSASSTSSPTTSPSPSPSPTLSASPSPSTFTPPSLSPSSVSPTPQTEVRISISQISFFEPNKINIKPATKVTWFNAGKNAQTITSRENLFAPQDIGIGKEFSFVFNTIGDFHIEKKASSAKMTITVQN